jgi:hypothetical protein
MSKARNQLKCELQRVRGLCALPNQGRLRRCEIEKAEAILNGFYFSNRLVISKW